MPIPCESTPRRSVRTINPAVISAGARGIFIAMRVATMKVSRWVWRTMTGASGMAAGSSEAGDLDAGVLQLVAPVDRGEDRGDALRRPRAGQTAAAHRGERPPGPWRGQRADDPGPEARRVGVRFAEDRPVVGVLAQLVGFGLGRLPMGGADDDRVADERPSRRQSRAFLSRTAE